ncbi:hypothetical protein ABEB36_012961 [Hypothenemus hampei]|uniref:Medium-chain acyl-CoA ligase ACSF2, mitochondrial n=1 Tax=Hypothenemus hampei TaxID=57062 RepID=A0ABD1E8F4_HYPHA
MFNFKMTKLRIIVRFCRNYASQSYFHNPGKEPLRALTMGQLLEQTAKKYPDRPALISRHQNQVLTFQQVLEQADVLAAAFNLIGLQSQDKVGIWAPNIVEWYITHMACARGGIVLVHLNPAYQSNEIKNLINSVGIKGIVCAHKFKTQNYYQHLLDICPELSKSPPGGLTSPNAPSLKSIVVVSEEDLQGAFKYKELMAMPKKSDVISIKESQHLIDPDQVCHMQLTSGTTGTPKAPMLSHFHLVNNSYYIGKGNELDKKHHKICVQVPFFHVFGTTITIGAALNHGATLVVSSLSFNSYKSLEALKDEKCTVVHGTPTMYVDLIKAQREKREDLNVNIAVCGGAPCSPQLFKQMMQYLGVQKVKSVYGLSETIAVVFQSRANEDEILATSTVGHLMEHLEAKVVDTQGLMVPTGTPGELLIRGYATTLGYWQNEMKTKELIDPSKWLHTGDQFILMDNGYGQIVGRIKDVIIRGGENIYPKEIEDHLNTHPDILESQVVGIPHERLGEEVCAVLRIQANISLTLQNLDVHCRGKIAHFNIPSRMEIVDSFPKTASGKVQKLYCLNQQVHHANTFSAAITDSRFRIVNFF